MQMSMVADKSPAKEVEIRTPSVPNSIVGVEVGLLTGCQDRPYAFGLALALISKGVRVDIIGGDETDSPELHATPNLRFLNLRGDQSRDGKLLRKLSRVLTYYARLMRYAMNGRPKVFHILWNHKFEYFDRTLLMLYFKMLGKKIALTAHNVNQGKRDSRDSWHNRLTLKIQYRLADHIFVHTPKMKTELVEEFGVRETAITIIRHPINNAFPDTDLTSSEAKRRLGIAESEKTILFFGRIRPYKGLEYLLSAFQQLTVRDSNYKLIVASEPKKGSEEYLEEIRRSIGRSDDDGRIISNIQFIPDQDIEIYFKAADVLVLPYKDIFQSGVLFLGYSFGLPVIATDVGSFRDEILDGKTGFVCRPSDPDSLAETIEIYFSSDLFKHLKDRRTEIKDYANANHSWQSVAELTRDAYAKMLERNPS